MRKLLKILILLLVVSSCKEPVIIEPKQEITPTATPIVEPTSSDYSGSVFKGPFLVGSTVTIYPLDAELNQTGQSFSSTVISDDGSYDISGLPISGLIEIVADGFFYNEITGNVTNDRLTMRTITESTGTVNINLFSVLEIDRVRFLYSTGLTLHESKTQVIDELFSIFGFTNYVENSNNISVNSANGMALLALSSMFTAGEMWGSRPVSEIQQLITQFRVDFADGNIENEIFEKLKKSAYQVDANSIRSNMQNYFDNKNISVSVPAFDDVISDFILADIGENEIVKIRTDNVLSLEYSATPIEWRAGLGYINNYIFGLNASVSISTTVGDMIFRFNNGKNTIATSDFQSMQSISCGYTEIQCNPMYPESYPYEVILHMNVNGVIFDQKYSIIENQ